MSSSLPKTYKAAQLDRIGGPLAIRDVPLQLPGPGEVLVKVLACGVCGSDAALCLHGYGGFEKPLPVVPGHEIVGDVVAVGPSGLDAALPGAATVGARVGGPWHGGHDRSCDACQRGLFQMCDHRAVNGVTRDGGWAEYVLLRAEAVVPLPADCDPVATAPLLCAGVTVFNSLRNLGLKAGARVAVQGLGALGHLAVPYARAMGFDVVVLSSGDAKRSLATQLGASAYVNTSAPDGGSVAAALQGLGRVDAVVCTAPTPDGIPALLPGLKAQGTVLVLSPVSLNAINLQPLVLNGLRIIGWPSGHAIDSKEAVAFASSHGIAAHIERYPFSEASAALERVVSGSPRFKVVLDMQT